MRNSEGYFDPTAGKAMSKHRETKLFKTMTAPKNERPKKKEENQKRILYYATPVYVSDRK